MLFYETVEWNALKHNFLQKSLGLIPDYYFKEIF